MQCKYLTSSIQYPTSNPMQNKTPQLRYKIINACLTNKSKPYPTMSEIKDALARHDLEVSTRSFEADLEAMRFDKSLGFFAPIAFSRRQHLHATQEIVSDTKEGLVLTLKVIPNYELLQTLLSFGPEVEVLEPASVRKEMKDMLARSLALY